jgi:hypothetical protein
LVHIGSGFPHHLSYGKSQNAVTDNTFKAQNSLGNISPLKELCYIQAIISAAQKPQIPNHLNASCNNAGYDPPMQPRRFVDGVIKYSHDLQAMCRKATGRQNDGISASNEKNDKRGRGWWVQVQKPVSRVKYVP